MAVGSEEKKRERLDPTIWGLIVFAFAFLPRLLHLLSIQASPLFTYLAPDPLFFYQLAGNLTAGQTVGDAILFRAPLYPYLLALYYWVFGQSLFVPLLLQNILGSFACVMVYVIARLYYSNKIALTAGLVAALCGTLIFFGGELLPFTLTLALNLIAIRLLTLYEDSRKPSQLLIAGLLIGISAAAHPAILLFAPVVVLWIHQRLSQNRHDWLKQSLPFIVGILIMLVPVVVHNAIAGGETVVFETYGGVSFAAGNNTQADGGKPALSGALADTRASIDEAASIASQQTGRTLTASETGRYWLGQGFRYIFSEPLSWFGLQMRKVAYLFTGYEIPKDKQVYFFAKQSSVLRYLLWEKLIAFPFGILLPLALPALATGAALRRSRRQCILTGYVVSYVLIMLLFTVTARYRAMLVPIILIWSAAGFWTLVGWYRDGDFTRFYRWLAMVFAALIVSNGLMFIPGLSPRVNADFDGYMFTGGAYYSAGRYADAEQDFYTAAMLNPRSSIVFTNLGNTCARQNKDSIAVEYYRRAIIIDPNDDRPKKATADTYRKRNRIKELAALAVEEIQKNPKAVWAYHEYAYVHLLLEEYTLAADLYEQAFAADSTDYSAIFEKAGCYLAADMRMEAAEEYQRFLKYVPKSIEARANLAQVYARQNKLDLALEQFLEVSRAQPGNPAGYFNLATVYLQMGNFDKADEMLNTVASIDPNFPGLDQVRQMIADERAGKK